jgi:hypothetical protein
VHVRQSAFSAQNESPIVADPCNAAKRAIPQTIFPAPEISSLHPLGYF